MALTLLSFCALAIAGFGFCHALARRIDVTTNAFIHLGLGFFAAVAATGFVVSQAGLAISVVSQAILWVSCGAAAFTAVVLIRGRSPTPSAGMPVRSRVCWFNTFCLCFIAGYLALILLSNMSRPVFPWDAFTTWMFRAKAWVTADQAVDFVTLNEWLASGSGFTLPAAHYPIAISAIAAFAAALSGGWSDQAASIPWFFVMAASALIMAGLCRLQVPNRPIAAAVGATLLVTSPLVHWHGLLAGYADIWVMGTSGMGLAGICLWTQSKARSTLAASLLLLVLGCLWKSEGWLWLMLGCAVVLTLSVWRRLPPWAFVALALTAVSLGFAQPVDLGPFGRWGVTESTLSAGLLGDFDARPFNPAPAFLEMSILQGNFLMLIPLYGIALATLLIRDAREYFGYLLMALCLMAVHGVIFGLSEYSLYAETGTAINRFLLQNLPVLIVTITAIWQPGAPLGDPVKNPATTGPATDPTTTSSATSDLVATDPITTDPITTGSITGHPATARTDRSQDAPRRWLPAVVAGTGLIVTLAAALPLTLKLSSWGTPQPTAATTQNVAAAALQPMVGDLKASQEGYRFSGANIPVGVASIPLPQRRAIQPRYVVSHAWMQAPGKLSFYWINAEEPGVHSTPLPLSGGSILDMSTYQDFWQKPIQEMGFLAKPGDFHQAAIESVTLTDSLLDAIPALIHHWTTPAPLSHRIINTTTGHVAAPVTLQHVLVVALSLIAGLGLALWLLAPASRPVALRATLLAVSGLWLLGSSAHLNQVSALMQSPTKGAATSAGTVALDGAHLLPLVTTIKQSPALEAAPMLTASLDGASQFEAQRLPFMALPTSGAAVDASRLGQIAPNFRGTVVLLGKRASQLREKAAELAQISSLRPLHSGAGYLVLSPEVE